MNNSLINDEIMITTTDNPWNPYTHFAEWWEYDTEGRGYYTYQRLALMAYPIFGDSEENNSADLDNAIYRLIDLFDRINKCVESAGEKSMFPHYILAEKPKSNK